jgi:hypothetical protein
MRYGPAILGLALLLVAAALAASQAPGESLAPSALAPKDSCVGCHRDRQPGMMVQWDESVHAQKGVLCEDCHGDDHDAMFAAKGKVPAVMCAACHPDQTAEFKESAHGDARRDALKNPRLMAQIPAMQRLGCMGCHDIGGPRGGRCDACHGAHRFSSEDARQPEACGVCHCGPDHPHIEAYERSLHGLTFLVSGGDERQAPTCTTCHMPKGTHGVSSGITIGRGGHGAVLTGEEPPIPMRKFDPETVKEQREVMIQRCLPCHTRRVARDALEDADAIKREADRLIGEAVKIVARLHSDGLLDPAPEDRVAHPTAGHALVLGGGQLYENHSEAERIFFDIAKFAHSITFKGAYHQSPDHTHWLGMARLKAGIEELRAEERRLRKSVRPQ